MLEMSRGDFDKNGLKINICIFQFFFAEIFLSNNNINMQHVTSLIIRKEEQSNKNENSQINVKSPLFNPK